MSTQSKFSSDLFELTAISPLDGRYKNRISDLNESVSEMALIKTRIEVEANYLLFLSENRIIRKFRVEEKTFLKNLNKNLTVQQLLKVKEIEKITRHDVKASERFLREIIGQTSLKDITEMVHIGLTSEDINNLSYRLIMKKATHKICLVSLKKILNDLLNKAEKYKSLVMLSRTHGQSALPTTLGKELSVFADRLNKQIKKLQNQNLSGKLNGAVGNFNALYFVYPKIDWIEFSEKFVKSLGLDPNITTTQINPYDDISEYLQTYQRINNVIIGLNQDIWRYISDGWFLQENKKGEVGSSTMPQKINPIDFENSEGNLGMANSILGFMSSKLMISRLQRDLSDSTVIRNVSTALGFCQMGYISVLTGLGRIIPDKNKIKEDLGKDWSILTEGVQTILRKVGVSDPYFLIAKLVRGGHIDKNQWIDWVNRLPVNEKYKKDLQNLTPENYTGLAVKITERTISEIKSK